MTRRITLLLYSKKMRGIPHPNPCKNKACEKIPLHIREFLAEKRRLRHRWQWSRIQDDRIIYNRLKRKLQTALRHANNATFEHYLTSLSPSDNTLWKATKRLKRLIYRYLQSENRMGVGSKVTTKKLWLLRNTLNRGSRPIIS